jgi:DNA-binding MarR family transcriptional regulator
MVAASTEARIEELAHDLFAVVTRLGLVTPRPRRRVKDLKEIEFLTLAILHGRGTMIVGDIQRLLGVLPAQMSRIIRSLENRQSALITCRINPRDKRKIDVCMTESGTKALLEYESGRVHRIIELLRELPEDDQETLANLLDKVRVLLDRGSASFPGKHDDN